MEEAGGKNYSHCKDEKYKEAVDRALPWYLTAWRRRRKEKAPRGVYDEEHRVNLIGIVPWLVTAMNDLHKTTSEMRYAENAFEQQDWIDDTFFWYPNRAQYPDYVGASYKTHRELPAINSCQYSEGAAAACGLAKRVRRDKEKRRLIAVHGMRFCLQTQYDSYGSTYFLPVPDEAMGDIVIPSVTRSSEMITIITPWRLSPKLSSAWKKMITLLSAP